jgi:spore germination cell wall hydrolase CwlJ-like protein
MALNVYHEARGSTRSDQEAVALVTRNRLESGIWGNTVCAVVLARRQFSWTVFSESRSVPRETQAWVAAQQTAYRVYSDDTVHDITNGADHFYAASMPRPPAWAARGVGKQRIGQHIYMRIPRRT